MARCFPAPDDWADLRVDLTDGERHLTKRLIGALSDDWCIYLQPHVGGTRPDLVLVHPRAGIQLIEVKDYDLGAYDLSGDTWQVRTGGGLEATRSPFDQVDEARDSLFRVLLPFAEEARATDPSVYGFVRAGVYFHNASPEELEAAKGFARRSLGSDAQHYGLAGPGALPDNLVGLVPILSHEAEGNPHVATIENRIDELGVETDWDEVLHGWLHPTPDEALQNEPLRLTTAQKQAARRDARRLLVTGPAGSGKTLVLARRAARRLLEGKETLLLGFNITLWHYVRDFVARGLRAELRNASRETAGREAENATVQARYTAAMRRLWITHYHSLTYRMWETIGGDRSDVHPEEIVDRLLQYRSAIAKRVEEDSAGLPAAEALLVDEGQDWGPKWLRALGPILQDGTSVTIAADPEQRIYEHAVEHPRALFGENPEAARLEGTARVPAALLPALNASADRWLGAAGGDLEKARQVAMDFSERPAPKAIWMTTPRPVLRDGVVAAARQQVDKGVNPSQIAVLVPTHEEGLALEPRFEQVGIDVMSLCTPNPDEDRSDKHAFWRLDSRLKLSTVHSFKGWEADVVIVLLTQLPPEHERDLLHVALTRTRAVTCVVAPPGAEDLPAWTHRNGRKLVGELPALTGETAPGVPDRGDRPALNDQNGQSDLNGQGDLNGHTVPPSRAPHPVDCMR